ncbi:hypothetical protein BROUX41_000467 [Berkeleyomyces rouxiae]|uniref:uncharacterized protein n=1 Tax=Berkeleyomyces rouxiae TaxID=2035830 RepID=UPI003B7BCBE0
MLSYTTSENPNEGYIYRHRRHWQSIVPISEFCDGNSQCSPPFTYSAFNQLSSNSTSRNPPYRYQRRFEEDGYGPSNGKLNKHTRMHRQSSLPTRINNSKNNYNHDSLGQNPPSRKKSKSGADIEKSCHHNKDFVAEMKDLRAELDAFAKSLSTASSELRHYKKNIVPALREEVATLTAANDNLRSKAQEAPLQQSSCRTLEQAEDSLREMEVELGKFRLSAQHEHEKYKKADAKIARLRAEVNEWENRYEDLREAHSAQKRESMQKIEELHGQIRERDIKNQSYVDRFSFYESLLRREGYLRGD